MYKKLCVGIISLVFLAFINYGCGRSGNKKDVVLAKANDSKIYVKDFTKALAFRHKKDPFFRTTPRAIQDQLNLMIDRTLLIQEAKKENLDEKERFVNTIKTFWEQTLIRDLMKEKEKEFSKAVSVNEDEMKGYYENLKYEGTFFIIRTNSQDAAKKLLGRNPDTLHWDEEVGPISYDEVSSQILAEAFSVPQGGRKMLTDGKNFYIVYVKEKREIPVRPYGELKDAILEKIEDKKIQVLFEKWLEGIKGKADIDVNEKALKEISYRHGK